MTKDFCIGTRKIGALYSPYVIAEAAVSHQGCLKTAIKMVYMAKSMGCDAIKFQMHVLENEMLDSTPKSANFSKSLYDTLKDTELSLEAHIELSRLCSQIGITYLCTPFSAKAADILHDTLSVQAFKVGSGEMTNFPLLEHLASKGIPLIVSTGMATLDEISDTVSFLKDKNVDFMLTHCVSAYPCPYNRVNIGNIPKYIDMYDLPVGLSDHSIGIYTALGAVAVGASLVEKHFTLDKLQEGPDHAVSLEPYELGELVKGVNAVFLSKGDERRIFPEEEEIVAWARESVVSECFIPKGSVLSKENVWVKRPSPPPGCIPAKMYNSILGKVVLCDIEPDTQISWDQLQ